MRICLAVIAASLMFCAAPCQADSVPIGMLSLDLLIPGAPDSPGVNSFSIANLTGDPALGGNAVPPTFPVMTPLIFANASLQLFFTGGATQTIALGDISPGFLTPDELQFSDSVGFSSAVFSAELTSAFFELFGGQTITAASSVISAQLVPESGGSLVAGSAFALITVAPAPEVHPMPEPGVALELCGAVLAFIWLRRRTLFS